METTEKKPKNGFDRLKVKYAKLKAENDTLKDLKTATDKFADEWKRRYDKKKEEQETAETEKAKLQDQLAQALSERNNYSAQLDRAKTEIHNLKIDCNEKQSTIEKQGTKISELSGDLANAQSEAREYRSKFEEAVRRMGWLRRLWYGYDIPQFTDEDHWHD